MEEGDAAAGDDAFLDRGAGRVHGVLDAILALLHLDLGGAADADHRNAAGELGQPLLQLLLVVVGRRLFDLRLDLGDACLDVRLFAGADGSVVVGKIMEKDQYNYGFDAQAGEYGNLVTKGVIDPTKVVRSAIQGAASIAGLLITTEAMVAEVPQKKAQGGMPGGAGGMGGMGGGMDF